MIYLILHKWTCKVIILFFVPTCKFTYLIIHSGWSLAWIFMKERVNKVLKMFCFWCPDSYWDIALNSALYCVSTCRPLTPFPPVITVVVCFSHLFMFLGSLYCEKYGPRSDCSQWSSLIRVHIVCFHDKSSLKCTWIYVKSRWDFRTEKE